MKKFVAVCFLFSLCCTSLFAQDTTAKVVPDAQIKFVNLDSTYDFGFIPSETVTQYQFEIKNTGKGDLVITDIHCGLAIAKITWPHKPIKHGKKGIIAVSITPHEIGSFKDDMLITSNATDKPYPFIHISGAIIPQGDPGSPGNNAAPKKGKGRRGG